MGVKLFDRKFGASFAAALPATPGVYLFHDDSGTVLYVGKAINLRRRLLTYRNASRRKTHRKMRILVRSAATLEVRPLASERDALLLENELIRTLRPPHNVDGAYAFLYPAIGVCRLADQDLLCMTTSPEHYAHLQFRWYGAFRSRPRAIEAFQALVDLLRMLAHSQPKARLPKVPMRRGSHLVGFRQLDPAIAVAIETWLSGESCQSLGVVAEHLLEKPRARRDAELVQERLHCLRSFYESDLRKLRAALAAAGIAGTFIERERRDALFIATRARDRAVEPQKAKHHARTRRTASLE